MNSSRQMFAECLPAEAGLEVRERFEPEAIRRAFLEPQQADPPGGSVGDASVSKLVESAVTCLGDIRERFAALATTAARTGNASALGAKASLELMPFFVATQFLLHGVCGNWNNEDRHALRTLRMHALDLGCGQPRASRIDRYHEVLRSHACDVAGASLLNAAADTRISDGAFVRASELLLLSHFPESFAGEILGANLFLRRCGRLPPFELVRTCSETALHFLDLGRSPGDGDGSPAEHAARAILEYLEDDADGRWPHVAAGFDWARRSTIELCNKAFEVLAAWLDPREAALQLILRRRHDASRYHDGTKLDGRMMTDLLDDPDPGPLLDHLARSHVVRPGDPSGSPLLDGLISPRSKMFRIFGRDEVAVLRRWIESLPCEGPAMRTPACRLWSDDRRPLREVVRRQAKSAASWAKPRQAYGRLLHAELSASECAYARRYVEAWLDRSAAAVANGACVLPDEWTSGQLQAWVRDRHDAGSVRASDLVGDVPPREEVVTDVCSLAPLTMIDGAWLAGFAHPMLASSEWGFTLFETYFDELGNGEHDLNHPAVYRDLMQRIVKFLPGKEDADYASSPIFDDVDFELPVFWLSIGKFPLTYRPEILGMNLAMELSGVGAGYRRTGRILAAHGLPTTFVDLHNSIDNISTGHSAWAVASIDACMAALPRGERIESWRRIRTGYVALNPPARRNIAGKIKQKLKALL